MSLAVATIPDTPRRDALPAWAGALGLVLGSALGAAACYALASVL
jgi:hypothetical protein